jgi:hypothetical protein
MSGHFIEMAKAGTLAAISELIRECERLTDRLDDIEERLRACNNPIALARLEADCRLRRVDFVTQLQKLVRELEGDKAVTMAKLQQAKDRIVCEEPGLSTSTLVMPSAPPVLALRRMKVKREIDPNLITRGAVIDHNLDSPDLDICKKLDQLNRQGDQPNDQIPSSWYDKFGVKTFVQAYRHPGCRKLVHKMFSVRRRRRRQVT